jgi:uncharacterized protein (DUF1778 family)
MTTAVARKRSDATITMRLPTETRELIDRAAALLDKSRTDFMLEAARASALDVMLDQRMFQLDAAQSRALAVALAEPAPPTEALRRLMAAKAPWE